ncbi:MAG: haloacid dehalogenase type II [Bacteroidota bacterium]
MNPYRAIVFDAYGTLLDVYSLQAFLDHTFGEKGAVISQIWRQKQLSYTWLRTLMGSYRPFSEVTAEALRFACASVGIELTAEQQADLLTAYDQLDCFPVVPAVLEQLAAHYPLAVLSNADEGMLQGALQHNHLLPYLSAVLSANSLQQFKPLPAVYQLATDHFQCLPEELLFVSGNTWDVNGARAFGLSVAWLNRQNGPWESLDQSPHLIVPDLLHLQAAVI